ncbi:trypsin-1 [Folsomia candida]|uniref:Anionic trypsin-2 n=1 Tax=Folsomia candida TaxID=158441 RepID=A0A226EWW4_FOLCA|nr:trypsin-1 [Folsomia candida]OXA61680.1 Anionic trypsin-2 [Folsomia candida]
MNLLLKIFSFSVICCLTQVFVIISAQKDTPGAWTNSNATTTSRPSRTRIVGGIETKRNEYPFIVSLFRGQQLNGHFCGGSIIDTYWVVTAAHCVTRPDFKLTAGEHDLRKFEGTEQTVSAVKIVQHPEYNKATFENDIALVKVFPPFNYTEFIKNFQLPSIHFIAAGNVTTAGWGVLEEGSTQVSPVLRKVTVSVFPNIDCSKTYGKDFHTEKMICAADKNGGKDACQGDSGGALLCDDVRFGDTLCGVVSFGFGCARQEFAGVYTKMSYYVDWIIWEQTKDANSKNPDVRLTTIKPKINLTTHEPILDDTITVSLINTQSPETTSKRPRRKWGIRSGSIKSVPFNFSIWAFISLIAYYCM